MPEIAHLVNFNLPVTGIHHFEPNCQAYVLNNLLGTGALSVAERFEFLKTDAS